MEIFEEKGGRGGLTRSGSERVDRYHVCENQMHKMFGVILKLKTWETHDTDKVGHHCDCVFSPYQNLF